MKTRRIMMMLAVMFAATSLFAQSKTTEEFKVYGKCGMCKTRIEKTVADVPGVVSAVWDQKTNMLDVTYKTKKTKALDIHKAVAKVGHDTELERSDDKVYAALPGCCHYDRPAAKKN